MRTGMARFIFPLLCCQLDRSSFTAEQLKRADEIAKQILEERAGRRAPAAAGGATAAPAMPRFVVKLPRLKSPPSFFNIILLMRISRAHARAPKGPWRQT